MPIACRPSISAGHGVLLTPNHSRDEDPFIVGELARQVGSPLFLMASWHLFMRDRLTTFMLRRAGTFSIYREGIDRSAVNTAVEILETAQRPLVIFPEGFISRTNDRLNDLMDGTALIRAPPRRSAQDAAARQSRRSPRCPALHLSRRHQRRRHPHARPDRSPPQLAPQRHLQPLDRIYKTGGALLALKELEYTNRTENGDLGQHLAKLIDAILDPLEAEWLKEKQDGIVPARVKKLRSAILPDMTKGELDEAERNAAGSNWPICTSPSNCLTIPPAT